MLKTRAASAILLFAGATSAWGQAVEIQTNNESSVSTSRMQFATGAAPATITVINSRMLFSSAFLTLPTDASSNTTAGNIYYDSSAGTVLYRHGSNWITLSTTAAGSSSFGSGGLLFGNATAVPQTDTSALYWDNTNKRLGVGENSPEAKLDVTVLGAVTTNTLGIDLDNGTTNATTDGISKYGLSVTSQGTFTGGGGSATTNYGIYSAASGADDNYAVYAFMSGSGYAGVFVSDSSTTNAAVSVASLRVTTSGTAAAGLGARLNFFVEADNGTSYEQGSLRTVFTSAVAPGTSDLVFATSGGDRLRLVADGTLRPETSAYDLGTTSYRWDLFAGTGDFSGAVTLGDGSGDTVTANAASWTFANDTNLALSGGINGLSFDTDTLSVDATNDRVGVGTTSPQTKLDVSATNSTIRAVTTSSTGYASFRAVGDVSTQLFEGFQFGSAYAGNDAIGVANAGLSLLYTGNTSSNLVFRTGSTNGSASILFGTGNPVAERMRINASGNIIFGTGEGGTPTATTVRGAAASGTNIAGANLTIDASNGTGTGGSGALIFRTAPTAGSGSSANTLAERMRINASGNIIFGAGEGGTPTAATVRGAAASGTNIAGADLTFDASNGTGTGGSGALVFRTAPTAGSGSSANTLATRMQIHKDGTITVGTGTDQTETFYVSGSANVTGSSTTQFAATTSSTTDDSASVSGTASGTSGRIYGVYGTTPSTATNASGVYGYASGTSGYVNGVYGKAVSQNANGVYADVSTTSAGAGAMYGVYSVVSDTGATASGTEWVEGGVFSATKTGASGGTINVRGIDASATGDSGGASTAMGIYATATGADTNYAGYFTANPASSGSNIVHVIGTSSATSGTVAGIESLVTNAPSGTSATVYSIHGQISDAGQIDSTKYAVFGEISDTGNPGTAFTKTLQAGRFVSQKTMSSGAGAATFTTYGVYAEGAVTGEPLTATTTAYGIYATASGADTIWAGYFNGNVGLANSSSSLKFAHTSNAYYVLVENTSDSGLYYSATNNELSGYWGGAETFQLDLDQGQVGIGKNPGYDLELAADSAAKPSTNTWTVASDGRLKKDIRPFREGMEVIRGVSPVWYRYNGLAGMPTDKENIGVIAQEIREVAPYTVGHFRDKGGSDEPAGTEYLDFNSHALTFVTINALKELDQRIARLEKRATSDGTATDVRNKSALMKELESQRTIIRGLREEVETLRRELRNEARSR